MQRWAGNSELRTQLMSQVAEGRNAHSYLIAGEPGSGNLALAVDLMMALFCEKPGAEGACGQCDSCTRSAKMEHPDLHLSFPTVQSISRVADAHVGDFRQMVLTHPFFTLNDWTARIDEKMRKPIIGAEESQRLVRAMSLKSFAGGRKVVLIWMADSMNSACANKLLKVIEEPPAGTVFILCCTKVANIIPTIRSRCRITNVPMYLPEDVISNLQKLGVEPGLSESVAPLAQGNMARAIALTGDMDSQQNWLEQFVVWMRLCFKVNIPEALDLSEELAGLGREQQKEFLNFSMQLVRQSLLTNYNAEALVVTTDDQAGFVKKFAPFISGKNVVPIMQEIDQAIFHVERNVNSKIVFSDLTLRLVKLLKQA